MVNLGDLIQTKEGRYGEVVGKKRGDEYERVYDVYYISETPTGFWRYETEYSTIHSSDVQVRVRNPRSYEVAWGNIGFLAMQDELGWKFLPLETSRLSHAPTISDSEDDDETDTETPETSDAEGEDDEETTTRSYTSNSAGSLDDFIVDTDDMDTDDEWNDTNPGVREGDRLFSHWVPESPGEAQFKATIERLEARAKHARDERRMRRA